MTDSQLTNNNNNNNNNKNNNNNNDGENYLHKKFKKIATTEVTTIEPKKNIVVNNSFSEPTKRKDSKKDSRELSKDSIEISLESTEGESIVSRKNDYVCPYCRLSYAKSSVLQKHIRAHTNERPYLCVPCEFAFKTKSNFYKHCRSRTHVLKMESGDAKISEDSDVNLSDRSNGTSTSPSPLSSIMTNLRTIKTGKIYKPKFHTVLQCANNKIEKSFLSFTSTNSSSSMTVIVVPKPNLEYQVEEHIDKIITNNHVLIDTMDPRLYKLIQRQQSLVETKQFIDQPLNLSFAKEFLRKGCYSESFVQQCKVCLNKSKRGSIIKNLLLKNQNSCRKSKTKNGNYYFVPHSNTNILNIHRRYYWNGSSRRKYQLEIEKRESNLNSKSSDYYSNLMSFPSCDSLLGNTRLIDTYISPMKKHRLEFVQTALQSLEELDKCPRINSLQMFGGENRILNNTGESKMITFESQSINSRKNEEIVSNKCITSETSSVVIRSDLHSGGTMVYKPLVSTSSSFISLPNVTKILSPIIPNISTPSILSTTSVNLTKTEKSETKLIENSDVSSKEKIKPNKFLRHISLSLKPGTFTTKKYHEITPTGNMLPLISPETPRSKKSYRQLYLNRHAYTYFGLKCSTRVFYCTLNKPQPMYVTQQHYGLSMYSNWKICKEAPSDIDMAHYDSKHRPVNYTIAWKKQEDILTHSSHRFTTPFNSDSDLDSDMQKKARRIKMLDEDLESNKNNMYGKEKV